MKIEPAPILDYFLVENLLQASSVDEGDLKNRGFIELSRKIPLQTRPSPPRNVFCINRMCARRYRLNLLTGSMTMIRSGLVIAVTALLKEEFAKRM